MLRNYLILEALYKKNVQVDKERIGYITAKIPHQPNHCDCGVYLLHYIETFYKDPQRYLGYIIVKLL
jgi:Ulp1 family protease